MPVPPRACMRCIERKRKCDHKRPRCGFCSRTAGVCEYPLPQQRRGPLGGFSRLAAERAAACEDALAFLLAQPVVRSCLVSLDDQDATIPQVLDRNLSKESRSAWWSVHPLDSITHLLSYPTNNQPTSSTRRQESAAVRPKSVQEPADENGATSSDSYPNDAAATGYEREPSTMSLHPSSTTIPQQTSNLWSHQELALDSFESAPVPMPNNDSGYVVPYGHHHGLCQNEQAYHSNTEHVSGTAGDVNGGVLPNHLDHRNVRPDTTLLQRQSDTTKLDTLAAWSDRLHPTNPLIAFNEVGLGEESDAYTTLPRILDAPLLDTTLPKTLDATHLDSVGQPYILDHLHSWKDLMRESSNNRSQIQETPSQRPPTFSIPVFRWFGNTSIAPGIVKTQARIKQLDRKRAANNDASSPATEYREKGAEGKVGLFDSQDATYPSALALNHLLEVFITHFMCHFPFLDSNELRRANQSRALSKGLVNSICALASRFSDQSSFLDSDGHPDFSICDSYSDAAKQALLPLLAIPTLEVLQSYILLTWSEWGNGRDAGVWMYTGICVRMAQDLGLAIGSRGRAEAELDAHSMAAQQKAELTFWAVFFLDRVVSYGTGRRVTLSEEDIQIPLPHSSIGGVPYAEVPRDPWFAMIRILRYRGMVGDIMNAKEMKGTESASLSFLQREMADYYRSLPPSLQFTPKNFELYSHTNQTSTFTLIHLLFHATIILLHRPSLLQASDANINFALIGTLHERSKEISKSSARSIADILHYVELLGPSRAIYCNLFVDHAIFLTAMSFLADLADEPQDTDSMLSILADTQFQRCRAALRKLASYWGGTEFVCGVIDQRSAGLTGGAVHSLEARNPGPMAGVECSLDRLRGGGSMSSNSMNRPASPTLAEGVQPQNSMADAVSNQGLSFVGLLDPEPRDRGRMSLVEQAWLGSSLLSVETGATAEGLEMRQDRFMLFQDLYG